MLPSGGSSTRVSTSENDGEVGRSPFGDGAFHSWQLQHGRLVAIPCRV